MRVLNSLVSLGLVSVLLIATATAEEMYTTATGGNVAALGVFRECDLCPEMVVLPTGSFTMGSSEQEADAAHRRFFSSPKTLIPMRQTRRRGPESLERVIDPDKDPAASINPFLNELPAHRVAIDLPVAMGRTEVTRAQWAACVEEGGCARGLKDKPSAVWGGCLDFGKL